MTTVFADLDNFPFSNGLNNHHHSASSLYDDQRALQLAVELSKLGLQNNTTNDSHSSSCSDPGYCDTDLLHLTQRKSQNTTECVPVPSSEHVAEIVGRQGTPKLLSYLIQKIVFCLIRFKQKTKKIHVKHLFC